MSELSPKIAREQGHPKGLGTVGHEGWEEGVESEAWILKWAVWKGMGEGGMEGPLQSQGKPEIARPLEGKSVQEGGEMLTSRGRGEVLISKSLSE